VGRQTARRRLSCRSSPGVGCAGYLDPRRD
jgi:hypothetical protein